MLHTSKHAYQQMFMEMVSSIRQHGVTAPIYVSVATRCYKLRALRKRYIERNKNWLIWTRVSMPARIQTR